MDPSAQPSGGRSGAAGCDPAALELSAGAPGESSAATPGARQASLSAAPSFPGLVGLLESSMVGIFDVASSMAPGPRGSSPGNSKCSGGAWSRLLEHLHAQQAAATRRRKPPPYSAYIWVWCLLVGTAKPTKVKWGVVVTVLDVVLEVVEERLDVVEVVTVVDVIVVVEVVLVVVEMVEVAVVLVSVTVLELVDVVEEVAVEDVVV